MRFGQQITLGEPAVFCRTEQTPEITRSRDKTLVHCEPKNGHICRSAAAMAQSERSSAR